MIVYAGSARRQLRAFGAAVIVTPLGTARFVTAVNDRLASQYYRPTVDVMLRITGKRIATPVCALARNDMEICHLDAPN